MNFLAHRDPTNARPLVLDAFNRMIEIGARLDSESDYSGASLQFDRLSSAFGCMLSIGDDRHCEYVLLFRLISLGLRYLISKN
jgi:hypothetical protein